MGSDGGHWIPMGAFAVGVDINVGDMGSSEREREAWLKQVEAAKGRLSVVVPALAELADVYLRGDHPYRFLRDRLNPVFPEESSYVVDLPLDQERLGPWLRARGVLPPNERFSLGLSARERLTPWERDKIAANFHLSQRGPGGYLHGWPGSPALGLFENQLRGRFLGRVDLGDLLPLILEGGRLPDVGGKAFEQWPRAMEAWDVANTVWMLARDGDLAPWKAFCVEKARLKYPADDACFPEWVTGARWFPGQGPR